MWRDALYGFVTGYAIGCAFVLREHIGMWIPTIATITTPIAIGCWVDAQYREPSVRVPYMDELYEELSKD